MNIVLIFLCFFVTVGVILWAVWRTKVSRKPSSYAPPVSLDQPLTLAAVSACYEDDELICRPGFLRLALTEAYPVEDTQLGLFVGYAKADPQHDAVLLITDQQGTLRGQIQHQPQCYEQLMASRRATCYGVISKSEDHFRGEICLRVR